MRRNPAALRRWQGEAVGEGPRPHMGRGVYQARHGRERPPTYLAEASELDRSYIGGVERGERKPALDAIFRLATALKVAPAALFDAIGGNVPQAHSPEAMEIIPMSILYAAHALTEAPAPLNHIRGHVAGEPCGSKLRFSLAP